jgi:hypothetical protein
MANEVQIRKTVYRKEQFDKVVNRNFTTFSQPPAVEEETTIDQFFELYEQFYFEIPIEGDTNSHRYLIQRSSELVDFEKDTQDIQPLLDEIATLRTRLLEAQQELIDANTPSQ